MIVSTDKQADRGVSLDAQAEKIRAMAVVHGGDLIDIIVDGGESAKRLQRPGMERLLNLVDAKSVQAVVVANCLIVRIASGSSKFRTEVGTSVPHSPYGA